jgi:hypothetical protein
MRCAQWGGIILTYSVMGCWSKSGWVARLRGGRTALIVVWVTGPCQKVRLSRLPSAGANAIATVTNTASATFSYRERPASESCQPTKLRQSRAPEPLHFLQLTHFALHYLSGPLFSFFPSQQPRRVLGMQRWKVSEPPHTCHNMHATLRPAVSALLGPHQSRKSEQGQYDLYATYPPDA